MIKVLKSFDSAHSAVSWMTQNRIEDTSIETTSTLKSMGMGRIPSGNYHVVLKGKANDLITGAGEPGTADKLDKLREASSRGGKGDFESRVAGHLGVSTPSEVGDSGSAASDTRATRLRNVGERIVGQTGAPKNNQILNLSVSKDDLVSIITKSVINVLKSEHEEPMEGTPEHYANWLSGLTSEDIRRHGIDMQNPLATYAEHYPEDLAKYVGGDEDRYDHFYDIYG